MTWEAFIGMVGEGENSFADNQPNTAVSIIDKDGEVIDAVVALMGRPTKQGSDILFPLTRCCSS